MERMTLAKIVHLREFLTKTQIHMWKTNVEKTVTMNYETSTGDKGPGKFVGLKMKQGAEEINKKKKNRGFWTKGVIDMAELSGAWP